MLYKVIVLGNSAVSWETRSPLNSEPMEEKKRKGKEIKVVIGTGHFAEELGTERGKREMNGTILLTIVKTTVSIKKRYKEKEACRRSRWDKVGGTGVNIGSFNSALVKVSAHS